MKTFTKWFAIGCLVTVAVASTILITEQFKRQVVTAQSTIPFFSSGLQVLWDHNGKDINGASESLASGEVALFAGTVTDANVAGVTPLGTITGLPAIPGTVWQNVGSLFTNKPQGNYGLAVRVKDSAGYYSKWSSLLVGTLDNTPPSIPSNIRVQIIISIGP